MPKIFLPCSIICLITLTGCSSSSGDGNKGPSTQRPEQETREVPSKSATPGVAGIKYSYDVGRDECRSSSGQVGYNSGDIGECVMVRNQNLRGQDLSSANLKGAYFSNTDLTDANLAGADLRGAVFASGTKLIRANLTDVKCGGCYFDRTTDISESDISGAHFFRTAPDGRIYTTGLTYPTNKGVKFDHRTVMHLDLNQATKTYYFVYQTRSTSQDPTQIQFAPSSAITTFASTGPKNALSKVERQYFTDVVNSFSPVQFNAPSNHMFYKMFPASNSQSTVSSRIQLALGERIRNLFRGSNAGSGAIAYNIDVNWMAVLFNDYVRSQQIQSNTILRLSSLEFNGNLITIDRTNMGLVGLADLFFSLGDGTSNLDKVETLLHESQHSICPVMPTASELSDYFLKNADGYGNTPLCNNGHVKCPKGHALEGEYACDGHAWGAYSVSLAVQDLIANHCSSCTDTEKLTAALSEKDMRSRILPLDKILNGTAGAPKTNSITYPERTTP